MILRAKFSDLNAISKLHCRVLEGTLNSKIGRDYVSRLYQKIIEDGESDAWISKKGNEVVGFLSATGNVRRLNNQILNSTVLFTKVLSYLIRHPLDIIDSFRRIMFSKYLKENYAGKRAWVLTLGVNTMYRKKGIGRKLIKQAIDRYTKLGANELFVDTDSGNQTATLFYQALGFQTIEKVFGNVILKKILKK